MNKEVIVWIKFWGFFAFVGGSPALVFCVLYIQEIDFSFKSLILDWNCGRIAYGDIAS